MIPKELSLGQKIALVTGATALVALIGFTIWFMIRFPEVTSAVRDIFLIILAVGTLALDMILIVLVWQIVKLLTYLLEELGPVVESVQETTGTVRGTATFVSDSVVNPAIEVVSKAAGVRRSIDVLLGSVNDLRPRSNQRSGGQNDG